MSLWMDALKDFWQRYVVTWNHVWKIRKQLEPIQRTKDEQDFLPAHLELIESPVSVAPKLIARLIVLFTFIALLWAILGRLDIVAVSQGKTTPGGHSKLIQPLETSVVKSIHVKNGDTVSSGQILLELTGIGSDNDYLQSKRALDSAKLTQLRNTALLNGLREMKTPLISRDLELKEDLEERDIIAAELLAQNQYKTWSIQNQQSEAILEQNKAELQATESQITKLKNIGKIEKQRLSDFKKLLMKNYLSQHEYYQQESNTIENSQDLKIQNSKAQQIAESIKQAKQEQSLNLQTLQRDTLDALRQANEDINQLTEQMLKTKQRQNLMMLKSPISGTVQQLTTHTVGGVVMEGQTIMVIAPTDEKIDVEALVENKDIGFVKAGQQVVVKIESFPYTRYGYLTGTVKHVSFDAIEHEQLGLVFSALITLDQSAINIEGTLIPLNAGMNVTAEIRTGKRRVIDYLLSPLQTKVDESFNER